MASIASSNGSNEPRHTILIIDDDVDWTDLLKVYFDDKYHVQTVNSPTLALETVRRENPSIIILDLVMPSIDGFGIIRRLSEGEQHAVPTILLTGWKSAEIDQCATEIGCSAVLSKPVSLEALDEAIASALENGRPLTARSLPLQ